MPSTSRNDQGCNSLTIHHWRVVHCCRALRLGYDMWQMPGTSTSPKIRVAALSRVGVGGRIFKACKESWGGGG